MSNSLDPNQAQHIVGPDLGPIFLQKLSAESNSRQIVFKTNIQRKLITQAKSVLAIQRRYNNLTIFNALRLITFLRIS